MRIIKNAKEEKKLHAIRCLEAGTMTVSSAAKRLEISERQVKRLKRSYREKGEGFILHGNCGRQPKKTLDIKKKQEILEIRNAPEYNTVNTLHFQEILVDKGIIVSYSFLHNLFKENKIRSCKEHRKSKKSPHQRRLRREREGELLQADGTSHQFFKDDKEYYCIHGFIDDDTGKITGLYMCKNECMEGYFQVTRQTIENFGVPEALYADGSSIFFSNSKKEISIKEQLEGKNTSETQYGTIMQELGIELIHAHSSQAKGRIERLWDTLQNRLITEFKISNITTMEEANEFLKDYVKKFNIKFGVEAVNEKTCFVPVQKNINLDILLSVKYDRTVDKCACFSLNNILFKINNINILPRKKVKILISKKIGVMAEYKGLLYTTTPILDKDKRDINSTESVNMIISQFVYLYCLKSERIS